MHALLTCGQVPKEAKGGIRSLGAGITGTYDRPDVGLGVGVGGPDVGAGKWALGPLQEPQSILFKIKS